VTSTNPVVPLARRRGATLIELLVVMALISALAALALMLLPSIANSDAAIKGAGEVQATCRIAQAMANGARQPRGVRFLPGGSANTANGPPNPLISTEMQYLESPLVMVAEPRVMVGTANDNFRPQVQITYVTNNTGAVTSRRCYLVGLTPDQEDHVRDGSILVLPTLSFWARINAPPPQPPFTVVNAANPRTIEVVLEVYPDAYLGGATAYRTFHFAVHGPPIPLLAEPTVPLPKDIGVDLALSYPIGRVGVPYDIMFAPSGQTITTPAVTGNTNIFLWVRDITKGSPPGDMTPISMPTPAAPTAAWQFDMNKFRRGGEQQIVGFRNGFIGTAPVLWPDAGGTYTNQDPYSLARKQLN
jgi:prepilin-type N-terminal cleavage/methylation domain-containing protein